MKPRTHKGVVFVADDEDAVRHSAEDILEDEGYLVLSARSGNEALSRMRGIFGPAVAIVDLVMPGMDGWALIEVMRADQELNRIPIIVLSGQGQKSIDGASRIIRKPYRAPELVQAVQELCR